MLSSADMGSVRRSNWRQFLPFVLLNIVVSALTMIAVLTLWSPRVEIEAPTPTPTMGAAAVAASAIPSPTATLRPSPTPHTYVVQPGDTMNAIAVALDISVEALMEANDLTDPDLLSAGQILIVPREGDGEEQAQAATEGPATNTPAPGGDEAPAVEIRGVAGPGELEEEVVRLLNSGGVANMAGWTLDDGGDNVYTFPAFTLHNGAVSVHTKSGSDTVIDLYWGQPEPVWTSGTEITLRDADGAVQSTFLIPGN